MTDVIRQLRPLRRKGLRQTLARNTTPTAGLTNEPLQQRGWWTLLRTVLVGFLSQPGSP